MAAEWPLGVLAGLRRERNPGCPQANQYRSAQSLLTMGAMHVATVSQPRQGLRKWEMTFTAWPASVGLARRQVRSQVARWGWTGSHVDDLLIIVSELLTNAIRHASSPGDDVRLRLQEIDGDCRVEVDDFRPDLLPPKQLVVRGESGRGLPLVKRLALDMDIVTTKRSKTVWARVLLRDSGKCPEEAA